MVACRNRDLLQYSSEGDPQSLKILCICSTYSYKKQKALLVFIFCIDMSISFPKIT